MTGPLPQASQADGRQGDGDVAAVGAGGVPDGDAMAPPQLAADAPGADVLQPVVPDFDEAVGHDLMRPLCTAARPIFGHRFGVYEPLAADQRLDDFAAALAAGHVERVGLGLFDGQAGGFHVGPQLLRQSKRSNPA
jgi:hypothetical protein